MSSHVEEVHLARPSPRGKLAISSSLAENTRYGTYKYSDKNPNPAKETARASASVFALRKLKREIREVGGGGGGAQRAQEE